MRQCFKSQNVIITTRQRQMILWIAALAIGTLLGLVHVEAVNKLTSFIATVYTRLFKLLTVPIITLTVVNTLASFGQQKEMGSIFKHTLIYTLLTTIMAAAVGLLLYNLVEPGNLPAVSVHNGIASIPENLKHLSYYDHILTVVPDNVVRPFLEGNILSVLIIAFSVGLALVRLPESEQKAIVMKGLQGLQSLLFLLIKALIRVLPLGIVAFSAQLSAQVSTNAAMLALGKYAVVILGGNVIQFFVVLPLFLLFRGISPVRILSKMMPAVLMALFTKSSVATLPVTMECAEQRLHVSKKVSRFVLPICTTINMNGCAAFILVTSLFVMQNGGITLAFSTKLLWLFIAVFSAVGHAGVPMGCYFLTLSLMSGIGAPIGIMGIILPVYTIFDMIETAENVWSDSCVCAMTDHDMREEPSSVSLFKVHNEG